MPVQAVVSLFHWVRRLLGATIKNSPGNFPTVQMVHRVMRTWAVLPRPIWRGKGFGVTRKTHVL